MDTKVGIGKLILRPETEVDVSHLLIHNKVGREEIFIEEVELKPSEQARVYLGTFEANYSPKGFGVTLSPKTVENEETVQQITKLELQNGQYELILHIANYSDRTVGAEVWKLI